jgi:hypothetical protein
MLELQNATTQAENTRPHTSSLIYESPFSLLYMCSIQACPGRLHETLHLTSKLFNGGISKLNPSSVGMSLYVSRIFFATRYNQNFSSTYQCPLTVVCWKFSLWYIAFHRSSSSLKMNNSHNRQNNCIR